MSNDSKTTDPRVEAGAKAWDKHMGGRYSPHEVEELAEEVAVILAAADAVDPRKPRTVTTTEELEATRPHGILLCSGELTGEGDGDRAFRWSLGKRTGKWELTDGAVTYMRTPSVLEDYSSVVLWEPEAEATR